MGRILIIDDDSMIRQMIKRMVVTRGMKSIRRQIWNTGHRLCAVEISIWCSSTFSYRTAVA